MSSFPALRALRVGCVRYLNARPLVHAYSGPITLDHPAQLARKLVAGELDVALVPVFTALEHPDFQIVDGLSISSRGPVYSVVLVHRGELSQVKTVALDPASRTSCHLLRVLLAEFHGLNPCYVAGGEAEAQLLIGNQAIAFREKHGPAFRYLDLGEDWTRVTALPFVFAVWLMRPGLENAAAVADELRELRQQGGARIEEIVTAQAEVSAEFARHYLRENIRFELGCAEKAGIARFRELLVKCDLLAGQSGDLTFV